MIEYQTWRAKYVRVAGEGGGLYVAYNQDSSSHPPDAVTVSEAVGWGLLLSVLDGHHEDFRGFLAYYSAHVNSHGLMQWQQVSRGGRIYTESASQSCATDADLDAAYALLLAGRRWRVREYTAQGIAICAALAKWCINPHTHLTNLGDWVGGPHDRTGPLKDQAYCNISRPSDWCCSHFLLFSQVDTERAELWEQVLRASVAAVQDNLAQHPTGLFPDFVEHDAATGRHCAVAGQVLERKHDGHFCWNACRVPWRLAAYYQEMPDDRVKPALLALAAFFERQPEVKAGYTLDGQPLQSYANLAFLGPAWALFRVLGHPHEHRLLHAVEQQLSGGHGTYYGETILLLCSLQCSPDLSHSHP